jgi:ABC-2 type transport system ATP-binding protein
MLQSGGLMPEVTVRELVTLVSGFHPRPVAPQTIMKRAGITDIAGQRVDRLSGGQAQRVRFALAIVGECELIVLDEPTTAMDVESRRRFWANMKAEAAEGRTVLFATHYLEEADQAADRILVINRGRLLADGSPAEIKEKAGARRMSFRIHDVDEAFLLRLPGLVHLEIRGDLVQVQATDSDAALYAILDAGYRPREIEVTSLGLEQAFLAITSQDDAVASPNIRKVLDGQRVIDPDLAVAALVEGTSPLTPREADVLARSADGATIAEIARALHLSEGTVRNYLSSCIQKTGARNRAEALRTAQERGWL